VHNFYAGKFHDLSLGTIFGNSLRGNNRFAAVQQDTDIIDSFIHEVSLVSVTALIVAAGGVRAADGSGRLSNIGPICGASMLTRTIAAFAGHPRVDDPRGDPSRRRTPTGSERPMRALAG
jgi:hypothetical protein